VTRPSLVGFSCQVSTVFLSALRPCGGLLTIFGVSGANTSTAPYRRLRNRIPNVNHRRAGDRDQLDLDTVSAMSDFGSVQFLGEGAWGGAWADAACPSNWSE
jgi:hypothetical protein